MHSIHQNSAMDELQRSIYTDKFRLAFHTKKGAEFQDWFVRLAGYAFGADFEEIRPYGASGDLKCDGRLVSSNTVFQCYAPDAMKVAALIAKINADFAGACEHWADMQEWVFVHNDARGLPPEAIQRLDELRKTHAPLKITTWSEPELFDITMKLDLSKLQALFGHVVSRAIMDGLVMADLKPIIDALERREPQPDELPLTPPSAQKLEKNALSEDSAQLLRHGRRKAGLVEMFFRKGPDPESGERIAEAFRQRYTHLKNLDLPADTIFKYLQEYAGFSGEPKRQGAALAVLAYFFDSCDIFEDPDVIAEAS